jgi:uncharacterized protein DUF5372
LLRLPAAWTSAAAPDLLAALSAGRAHFRVSDLLHLVALIARQDETRRTNRARSSARGVSSK